MIGHPKSRELISLYMRFKIIKTSLVFSTVQIQFFFKQEIYVSLNSFNSKALHLISISALKGPFVQTRHLLKYFQQWTAWSLQTKCLSGFANTEKHHSNPCLSNTLQFQNKMKSIVKFGLISTLLVLFISQSWRTIQKYQAEKISLQVKTNT